MNSEWWNDGITLIYGEAETKDLFTLVIVGGGIIGLATAQEILTRMPTLSVALVEKEKQLATHQTGHNSGVIHGGVYYKPGSLRAKLCVEGLHKTYEYCDKHEIPYKKCGKLIVATTEAEVQRLKDLYKRAVENNVPDVKLIDSSGIREIEPHCMGLMAIHSPHTGIVDWAEVARKYGSEFERMGGKIYRDFEVTSFTEIKQGVGIRKKSADYPILVKSKNAKMIRAKYVLTCAGLFADRVAEMTGEKTGLKIIPFRGEYLVLKKNKEHLCKGNIYPVPDPRFPFLGVHFTPRMNGTIWLGPNAILAFKREGYSFSDISLHDLADTLSFQGFRKFLMKNFGAAISELQNSIIFYRIQELQKYMPELSTNDVKKGPSGVRAQAMGADGSLIEDFVFSGKGNILHALNCPSPGATSSLAIGRELATKAQSQFGLK
ncbi:L-2-hydroxyglutarate dehydrogenase isoform X2 [Lycorma delicatula]|uniref:L-2-hydroxyglutarate dehydrogenase isoform X2 n=1 Tax=Lycorma delicatula TaxID=130591 RepID=UPI003F516CBD